MQAINISEFRGNLLTCLKKANAGDSFIVTSNGKPLATVMPIQNQHESARQALHKLGENAQIGDIVSPIEADWRTTQ